MRKIVLLVLLAFAINSCSVGDEGNGTEFVLLPIQSVAFQDSYTVNETANIMVTYKRPTDCYIFDGFYILSDGINSTIAVQAAKLDNQNCLDDNTVFEVPLEFTPDAPGTYNFKFYIGSDNGAPQYEEHTVVVE